MIAIHKAAIVDQSKHCNFTQARFASVQSIRVNELGDLTVKSHANVYKLYKSFVLSSVGSIHSLCCTNVVTFSPVGTLGRGFLGWGGVSILGG